MTKVLSREELDGLANLELMTGSFPHELKEHLGDLEYYPVMVDLQQDYTLFVYFPTEQYLSNLCKYFNIVYDEEQRTDH